MRYIPGVRCNIQRLAPPRRLQIKRWSCVQAYKIYAYCIPLDAYQSNNFLYLNMKVHVVVYCTPLFLRLTVTVHYCTLANVVHSSFSFDLLLRPLQPPPCHSSLFFFHLLPTPPLSSHQSTSQCIVSPASNLLQVSFPNV